MNLDPMTLDLFKKFTCLGTVVIIDTQTLCLGESEAVTGTEVWINMDDGGCWCRDEASFFGGGEAVKVIDCNK